MQILPVSIGSQAAQTIRNINPERLVPSSRLPEHLVNHRNGHYDFRIPSAQFLHGYSGWLWSEEFKNFVSGHPLEGLILKPLDQLISVSDLQNVFNHVDSFYF